MTLLWCYLLVCVPWLVILIAAARHVLDYADYECPEWMEVVLPIVLALFWPLTLLGVARVAVLYREGESDEGDSDKE